MNRFFLALIILPLTLSSQAQAGGGMVDNGGGFAEMQMYALEQKLPSFLGFCLQIENPCRLGRHDEALLLSLINDVTSQKAARIKLSQTCQSLDGIVVVNGTLFMEVCFLYQTMPDQNVVPRNPDELFLLLLRFYGHAMRIEGASDLFIKLSQNLKWISQESVAFLGTKYLLHQDVFQWLDHQVSLVSLETKDRTIDLTSIFQSHLRCDLSQMRLSGVRFQAMDDGEVILVGQLRWSCSPTIGNTQDFVLHLTKDLTVRDLYVK